MMAHHEFRFRLAAQRQDQDLLPGDVDKFLGLPLGTCEAWESARAQKPSEATIGRLAHYLGCLPSALDPSLDLNSNQPLLKFASLFERAIDIGQYQAANADRLWKIGLASRSFRGAADDQFWLELFEEKQKPPELPL